jgi:hypothetical protein
MTPTTIPTFPADGSRRAWFIPAVQDTDGNRVAVGEPCMFRSVALARAARHIAQVEAAPMTDFLLLTTEAHDLGVLPAEQAEARAREHANVEGVPVTIRDPLTDEVIATVEPSLLDA